jgi:Flp pilus assembly protein TadG
VFGSYLAVVQVARDGARAASLGDTSSQATQVAQQVALAEGLDTANLTVAVTGTAGTQTTWDPGTPVSCQVSYGVPVVVPLFWPILGTRFTVGDTAVFLAEGG